MNRLLSFGTRTGLAGVARQSQGLRRFAKAGKSAEVLAVSNARSFSKNSQVYNIGMSSNSRYILFILLGAAVGEALFGLTGDLIWDMNNRGKLYHHIDWSKWESIYVDDDDDEDDEDDE
mmetsp:Transcript_5331/g.6431  ORF Transcript_5331/g.6431 Transcript_5331/m.6431 type:complete len:119 (+) Transcript_5331:246-602(+)